MNHAVSYQDFPTTLDTKQRDCELYDAIVAAVSDINLTLPSSRRLTIEIYSERENNIRELRIYRFSEIVHSYTFDFLPNYFGRCWTLLTLGFVETERVEIIKADIESRYQYGPKIID